MRRLIEEYGTVLLYVITGIICITLFSLAFFGEGSSISKTISDSIDKSANNDVSIVYTISYEGMEDATFGTQDVPTQYTKEDRVFLPKPTKDGWLFAGWVGTRITEPTINVVIPEGSTGNRAYTATWTKGYYRINYDSNIDNMLDIYHTLSWFNEYGGEPFIRGWMTGSTESFLAEYGINPTIRNCGFNFLGHRFKGWNTKPDGTGTPIPVGTYTTDLIPEGTASWVVEEITLYAQWERIVYKIDYVHSNQAVDLVKNDENPTTYMVTDTMSLKQGTRANPILKGYTFNGWYTRDPYLGYRDGDMVNDHADPIGQYRFKTLKPGYTDVYKEDYIYPGTTGDLVLYSDFTPNPYIVNFILPVPGSLNNLTQKFSVNKTYNVDVTLKMPDGTPEPQITGYDFLGWVPAKTNADKKVRLDGTLEDKYIIVDDALTDEQVGYDENAYLEAVEASKPYEITLYPVFGPHQYLIEYSANGGINPPTSQVKYYGTNLQLKSDDFSGNPEGKTQRVGYTFLGWKTNCITHGTEEFYKSPTGSQKGLLLTHDLASDDMKDVTLEAIWKANTYTITFDLNIPMQDNGQPGFPKSEIKGGYVSSAQVTYDSPYGTALKDLFLSTGNTKPSSAYKYKFAGWYEEPECIHQVTSATIVKRAENHTLYARWLPVTYIIRLHSNY